jgi:hypothetical protein
MHVDNDVHVVLYTTEDGDTILDVDSVWLDEEDAIRRCDQFEPPRHVLIRRRKIDPSPGQLWDRRKDQFTQHELHERTNRILDELEREKGKGKGKGKEEKD